MNHPSPLTLLLERMGIESVDKSVGTTSASSARASWHHWKEKPNSKKVLSAKWAVQAAVRRGDIKRPKRCSKCGKVGPVIFHHTHGHDEANKLKGRFVCAACHSKIDGARNGKKMSQSMKEAKNRE